ncbi:MAG: class I SAM-dependent methyltransferase [Rhodobacteraceae bacterium]|nr:class I SAM-dependent methyltransferase [Paracoccaceae bacterium]
MPGKNSEMHLEMLAKEKDDAMYGLQWGDPDSDPKLKLVRDHFLRPYITPETTVVEIGPGGGRWTRYMLGARKIIVVDPFREILDEHARSIDSDRVERILNNGTDFPGVRAGSVDFVFSFGVFVHLDAEIVEEYLKNIRPLLHDDSLVFLQYSDKTKMKAFRNYGFAATNPAMIRRMLNQHGYSIVSENTTALAHSCMVLFRKKTAGDIFSPSGVIPVLPQELYQIRK